MAFEGPDMLTHVEIGLCPETWFSVAFAHLWRRVLWGTGGGAAAAWRKGSAAAPLVISSRSLRLRRSAGGGEEGGGGAVVQVVLRLAALRFAHVVPRRILQPGLDLKNLDYRKNSDLKTKNVFFWMVVILAQQAYAECTPDFCFRPKSSGILASGVKWYFDK